MFNGSYNKSEINPKSGARKIKNLDDHVVEFYYRGKLLEVGSYRENNCDYYQFTMRIKDTSPEFVLYMTKGLKGSGIFSSVDGQFIASKEGQEMEIKIIYRITNPNWKNLQTGSQIVSWELIE